MRAWIGYGLLFTLFIDTTYMSCGIGVDGIGHRKDLERRRRRKRGGKLYLLIYPTLGTLSYYHITHTNSYKVLSDKFRILIIIPHTIYESPTFFLLPSDLSSLALISHSTPIDRLI